MRIELQVAAQADGLETTSIGRWALDKYRLVSLYGRLFSTGMKRKWPIRTYVDLYAGSGFSRVQDTDQIYWGSPLLSFGVPDPFDSYIFCEQDPASLDALRQRVARIFPKARVQLVAGDCDEQIDHIVGQIPQGQGALSFCSADPYDLSIKFSSVERLASRRLDFLFVLALHMDANRNIAHFTNPTNLKVDEFLGLSDWRWQWKEAEASGVPFPRFLAEQFSARMQKIGYLAVPFHKMKQIRSDIKNLPLYHLGLFSKHERAFDFWDKVLKYGTDQTSFKY